MSELAEVRALLKEDKVLAAAAVDEEALFGEEDSLPAEVDAQPAEAAASTAAAEDPDEKRLAMMRRLVGLKLCYGRNPPKS